MTHRLLDGQPFQSSPFITAIDAICTAAADSDKIPVGASADNQQPIISAAADLCRRAAATLHPLPTTPDNGDQPPA